MQTSTMGFAIQEVNTETVTILTPYEVVVVLSQFAGLVTIVTLHPTTREVHLYTSSQGAVRYAIDAPPIAPQRVTDIAIDFGALRFGDTLIPNQRQAIAVPMDTTTHTLQLIGDGSSEEVLIIALLDQ
jgi:hypothetical protein